MHPAMKQLPKESPKCLHTLGGPVHGLRMNEVRGDSHQGIPINCLERDSARLAPRVIFIFRLLLVSTSRGLKQLFCS